VILPWDVAFDNLATWNREDQDQRPVRPVRRVSKERERELAPHTSKQKTTNAEDMGLQTPQPASQYTGSELPTDTEPLLEDIGKDHLQGTEAVTEGGDTSKASEEQQESDPLLEGNELEQPNAPAQGRHMLPTWVAAFRDYGRFFSRVFVYGLASVS